MIYEAIGLARPSFTERYFESLIRRAGAPHVRSVIFAPLGQYGIEIIVTVGGWRTWFGFMRRRIAADLRAQIEERKPLHVLFVVTVRR